MTHPLTDSGRCWEMLLHLKTKFYSTRGRQSDLRNWKSEECSIENWNAPGRYRKQCLKQAGKKKFMPPKLTNFLFSEFDKYIQLVVQLRITEIDFHVLVQPMHWMVTSFFFQVHKYEKQLFVHHRNASGKLAGISMIYGSPGIAAQHMANSL